MSRDGLDRRVAVLGFPGSNCEVETQRALLAAGVKADIVRWNESPDRLSHYGGFVLPGGFSYQDRVRAGALAAKETIVEAVTAGAEEGKPILGICNGCQILVEAGLVPGIREGDVEMALAPNHRPGGAGYYCRWVFLKHVASPGRCLLTRLLGQSEVLPIPIAHAEGRFVTSSNDLVATLRENDQVVLRYCDAHGRVSSSPDVNPNGSVDDIAGLCNPRGNVLALMPHPERAAWLRQVPEGMETLWATDRSGAAGRGQDLENEGPGRRLFEAFGWEQG
ncbi:MAG: phosphoribosylformylglycinamidine synthase I [Candidatus Eisenbacteria sp.]|nr:phosphoribosylformylglycinamidine synthase I [Candidatus Eisenbacteria bacterium]